MAGRRHDLGLYFALTCAAAVLIAGIGARHLWRQDRIERERAAEIDREKSEAEKVASVSGKMPKRS